MADRRGTRAVMWAGRLGLVAAVVATVGLLTVDADHRRAVEPLRAADEGAGFDDPRTVGYEGVAAGATPEGKVPVAFDDEGVPGLAGYIDEASESMDAVPPVLDLGADREVLRGWDVTDADGALVGYFVSGIGFVDLATARDPERLDALLAEMEALEDAHPPPTAPEGEPGR